MKQTAEGASMSDTLIKVEDLCKIYNPGENEVRALDHVNLEIKTGEFVAIIGLAGAGKSTLIRTINPMDDIYVYEYAGVSGCAYVRKIFS